MNPSGENSPPLVRRFPLSTLLLLCSLAVFFVWFFFMRVKELGNAKILRSGSAALAKKDTAGARSFFEAFLRANPGQPLAYADISTVCAEADQAALAAEYAQRGLDNSKKATDAQRALLYASLSQDQALAEPAHPQTKAIASARIALSLDPQNADLQNAAGYLLADNDQNLEEAEKLLRQALQSLKPFGENPLSDASRPMIEDSFGWLLYKKGDYAGAVTTLNQAVHDMPSGQPGYIAKEYYYHLAAAYRKAGQIDAARRTLDIALQYDPAFPEAKAEEALLPPPNTPAAAPPSASSPAPIPSSAPGLKL